MKDEGAWNSEDFMCFVPEGELVFRSRLGKTSVQTNQPLDLLSLNALGWPMPSGYKTSMQIQGDCGQ